MRDLPTGRRTRIGLALLAASAGLLLHGCVVGPDYVTPKIATPDAWHAEVTDGFEQGSANLHVWWTTLDDPVLTGLVQRAAKKNLDLRAALFRIQEARARRGIVKGEHYPTVDANGTIQRSRMSEGVQEDMLPGQSRTDDFYRVGVDAFWEIDVFGRVSRSVEAADADIMASVEDYRDVLVSLLSEVAINYIQVRTFQARLGFARENVKTQQGSLRLTRSRRKAGIAPELDVAQAEQNLATTESIIPTLEAGVNSAINGIAVLLGEHPAALHSELEMVSAIPNPPETVAVGLPADLLRQRPDVRRAERQLAAQTARIGVATADLYPRFSLFGSFGYEALDSGDVLESGSHAWGFGPSISWNIFRGGSVLADIDVQDARTSQLLAAYENAVLRALEEVENGLVSYAKEKVRRDTLRRAVDAARRSVDLVTKLYREGLTDFQNVLDSERSLSSLEDQLASSEGRVVLQLVRLYRSLGGGWKPNKTGKKSGDAN